MRDRGLLLVLLASALTFLASLYLPWEEERSAPVGLLSAQSVSFDGWGSFGQPAGILALGLVVAAAAAIARRPLASRLPLASGTLAFGFFALLLIFQTRDVAGSFGASDGISVHVSYASYLALASVVVGCLCAIALRRTQFERLLSITSGVAAVLTAGLLVAFLVPEITFNAHHASRTTVYQLVFDATLPVFIASLACLGLPLWTRTTRAGARPALAVGVAVLVGGYLSLDSHLRWPWQLWLLLACSLGLVAVALLTSPGPRLGRLSTVDVATVAAGVLLLVSLFLPWQKAAPTSGWSSSYSATAGGLTVVLLVLLLGAARFSAELAIGGAIYVTAAGFGITHFSRLEYGAPLGFAGGALLLVPVLRLLPRVDRRRLLVRLPPIVACAAFLAIPVLAFSERLSFWFELESPWRLFWLELAAILGALLLLGRWLTSRRDDPALVLLPFALLALTALDLIENRGEGISWLGIATVCLCLLLAAFGWIERKSGLETIRIPDEIWRVDRLPGEN